MTPIQAAYVAGLFDGEGTLARRGSDRPGYRLEIYSTNAEVIVWLKQFGGRIRVRLPHTPLSKLSLHIWIVDRGNELRILLETLLPYLIIKRAVVLKALTPNPPVVPA